MALLGLGYLHIRYNVWIIFYPLPLTSFGFVCFFKHYSVCSNYSVKYWSSLVFIFLFSFFHLSSNSALSFGFIMKLNFLCLVWITLYLLLWISFTWFSYFFTLYYWLSSVYVLLPGSIMSQSLTLSFVLYYSSHDV